METLLLTLTTSLLAVIIIYWLWDGYQFTKFKSRLKPGTRLINKTIDIFDPYLKEGMSTCTVIEVSELYVLVRFDDSKRTLISMPIQSLFNNFWEWNGWHNPDFNPYADSEV